MNQPTSRPKLLVSGLLTSLAFLSLAPVARAQDPAPAPEAPAPAPEAPAAPVETPAPAPAAEAAPPATAALEERLGKLEGEVGGLSEPFSAMTSDVAALKRIKISGYIQGRYEWHDDANYGVDATNKPRETNRFFVRRGRVKTTYVGDMSEFVLQIDATGDGVVLKDAEASFVLDNTNPWMPSSTPWELKLTMGQFKSTFGFEVLQSSGEREMPERAAVIKALYPGERERGVRLQYTYDWFKVMAAIVNGNFTNDAIYTSYDHTSWKDVEGRISGDFDFLVVGLSAHTGRFLKTTLGSGTTATKYERYSRLRLGADAQAYVDVPGLGGLSLRGETIWSRDKQMDFAEVAAAADHCKDADAFGWIGTAVQHIGDHLGVVVRIDQFDPTSSLNDACTAKTTVDKAGADKVTNYGFGLLGYISANLKASLVYEHLAEQEASKKDNDILTLQMQAKF